MKTAEIYINNEPKEFNLRELSPLLKIELTQLHDEFKKKASNILDTWMNENQISVVLDFEETVTFSQFVFLNAEVMAKSKTNKVTPEKQQQLSTLLNAVQPIMTKLNEYAWKEVEDEFLIEKLKLVMDKSSINDDLKAMLELPANDYKWSIQPYANLKKVSDFFRGKREKPTNQN